MGRTRRERVEVILASRFPAELVSKLLDALVAMEEAYIEGRLRPSELEAGHFAEIAYRVCQLEVQGAYTPLGTKLPALDRLTQTLGSSGTITHDSFRLHIPRVLLGVAEIRNRRGVGHPSGDVDPNAVDAELVLRSVSWVTAELVRHAAQVDIDEARSLVDQLASTHISVIEVIDGDVVFLDTSLSVRQRLLLLLLHSGAPVVRTQIQATLRTTSGSRFRTVLSELKRDALVYERRDGWVLTRTGKAEAEGLVRNRI